MEMEASDLDKNMIESEPRHLLCVNCLRGGGAVPGYEKIHSLLQKIKAYPDIHIKLIGAFDEIGARTTLFNNQTHMERKKDLDVLQRLGLCFGDTRTARDLFCRIKDEIPEIKDICRYEQSEPGKWEECPLSRKDHYTKGSGALEQAQSESMMKNLKEASCKAIMGSDAIDIRAHHLLCIICFIGSERNDIPLDEDNLYEAWMKIREDPDINITVIEGPGSCCICPPCHSYAPQRGICVASCHLRDRKKDLDTFLALGLSPGETLSAKELYSRIFKRIPHVSKICAYKKDTAYEWKTCQSSVNGQYEKGIKKGVY